MADLQSTQCPGCGANLSIEKDYCEYCGTKLSWSKLEEQKITQTAESQPQTYQQTPTSQPAQAYQEAPAAYKTTSGVAIASLVCALLGMSPIALVLGIIGVVITSKPDSSATGKGLAIAGIIISSVQILAWIIIIIVTASVGAAAASTLGTTLSTMSY